MAVSINFDQQLLLPALTSKFDKYSATDTAGVRLMNISGFKYLIKSCPNIESLGDTEQKFFEAGLPHGAAFSKSSKLDVTGYMLAIRALAQHTYPEHDPDAAFARFVLRRMLPQLAQDAPFKGLLAALEGGSPLTFAPSPAPPLNEALIATSQSTTPVTAPQWATPVADVAAAPAPPPPQRSTSPPPLTSSIPYSSSKAPTLAELAELSSTPSDESLVEEGGRSEQQQQPGSGSILAHVPLGHDTRGDGSRSGGGDSTSIFADEGPARTVFLASEPGLVSRSSPGFGGVASTSPLGRAATEAFDKAAALISALSASPTPVAVDRAPSVYMPPATPVAAPAALAEAAGELAADASTPSTALSRGGGGVHTAERGTKAADADAASAVIVASIGGREGDDDDIADGAAASHEWEEFATADGYLYYYNAATGVTQWLRPQHGIIHPVQLSSVLESTASSLAASRASSRRASLKETGAPDAAAQPSDGAALSSSFPFSAPAAAAASTPSESASSVRAPPAQRADHAGWRRTWHDVLAPAAAATSSGTPSLAPSTGASSVISGGGHQALSRPYEMGPSSVDSQQQQQQRGGPSAAAGMLGGGGGLPRHGGVYPDQTEFLGAQMAAVGDSLPTGSSSASHARGVGSGGSSSSNGPSHRYASSAPASAGVAAATAPPRSSSSTPLSIAAIPGGNSTPQGGGGYLAAYMHEGAAAAAAAGGSTQLLHAPLYQPDRAQLNEHSDAFVEGYVRRASLASAGDSGAPLPLRQLQQNGAGTPTTTTTAAAAAAAAGFGSRRASTSVVLAPSPSSHGGEEGGPAAYPYPHHHVIPAGASQSHANRFQRRESMGSNGGPGPNSVHSSSRVAGVTARMYPDVFCELPVMDERTADVIARSYAVASSKKMGYADDRPDIRPPPLFRINPVEQGAAAIEFGGPGAAGKASAVWASGLRANLYAPSADPHAPRSGEDIKRMWASGGLAPSETMPGYAYRHASATSMWDHAGTVYDRLMDVRGYTGTHKHRFDAEGRGKGLSGREGSYDYDYMVGRVNLDPRQGAATLPETRDTGPVPPQRGKR